MIKNMTEKQQHAWRTAADLVRENPLVTIGEVKTTCNTRFPRRINSSP